MLLALILAQSVIPNPAGPVVSQPSLRAAAFFEFAPANGAGMPAVCSTTAPTGRKGEVITFTRASTATCTKTANGGLTLTAIANGDLVVLSSNQARIEYDASAVLGPLIEVTRTNSCLRSQEFENAAYTDVVSGVAAITITANAATAPDGTLTADRFQIPAVTAAQYSLRSQSIVLSSTTSASVYVKGVSGSGTVCLALDNASADNVLCAFNSTTWTRCILENRSLSAAHPLYIGNYGIAGGACAGAQSSSDVYVWGSQVETAGAPFVTSYMPTTAAAATRADETLTATLPIAMSATSGSHAVSYTPGGVFDFTHLLRYDATAQVLYAYMTSALLRTYDGTNEITNNTPAFAARSQYRAWSSYTGGVLSVNDGTDTATGAFDGTMGGGPLTALSICGGGTTYLNGICTRVCADPNPARCR